MRPPVFTSVAVGSGATLKISTSCRWRHYTREADGWRLREYGAGEVVPLRGVEIAISVTEVYAKAFGER